jgi:hypothetical protein
MGIEFLYDTSKLHPYDLNGILTIENKLCGIINSHPPERKAMPYDVIELVARNDRTFRVYVKDDDLNVINVAGATGFLTVKKTTDDAAVMFSKSTAIPAQGTIGSPDQGELLFYIVPADTANLDIRQYVFDVRVTLASGKTYTVLNGVINLVKNLS